MRETQQSSQLYIPMMQKRIHCACKPTAATTTKNELLRNQIAATKLSTSRRQERTATASHSTAQTLARQFDRLRSPCNCVDSNSIKFDVCVVISIT